jgi:glycosyltransferase involved in cell wall biosynthesis
MNLNPKIAVIIPSYKVRPHILDVISLIGSEVGCIYVVDDCCPENSGEFVKRNSADSRVVVIHHAFNQGVGGAVMTGYRTAINDGFDILVKIDGDGQMDPGLIQDFVFPIASGEADYTKGNRFFDLDKIRTMPKIRILGNTGLSFLTKLSSGYWNIFDPTNGYTAIHASVARRLPLQKISPRYFFETDMLFRLNTLRAVVVDVPMDAKYGEEISNLRVSKVAFEFLLKNLRNLGKRILYNYYLRDVSIASIELPIGLALFFFGVIFGAYHWILSSSVGQTTPAGTVMLAALPVIVGLQLLLSFLSQDIGSIPTRPLHILSNFAGRSPRK